MGDDSVPAAATFRDGLWPTPPYFILKTAASEQPAACLIELSNGHSINGALLEFQPDKASLTIATADKGESHRLALDSIRCIRLTEPVELAGNPELAAGIGEGQEAVGEARDFRIRFRGGASLEGRTRGFVREPTGLFLYVAEGNTPAVTRIFVPEQQIEDLQVGPRLGHSLVQNHQVDPRGLAAAVAKQARLRQEKLGEQLLDRGIVSPDELKHALLSQRQRPSKKLGDILLESGVITRPELDEALQAQAADRGRRLGDILVEMGLVTVRAVQMALSDKLGIPFVNVRDFRIDPLLLDLIGSAVATRYQVLPLMRVKGMLVVAVEDPLAADFLQELSFLTALMVVPVIANPRDLRLRIAKEYGSIETPLSPDQATERASDKGRPDLAKLKLEELTEQLAHEAPQVTEAKAPEHEARVTDNTLVRLVNKIIVDAHAQGASDIHIESNPGRTNSRIRFRKDGDLEDYLELQPAYRNALVSRLKVMADLDIAEHRHGQDGKITFGRFGPLPIELRTAIVPTSNGLEDVVLRILGGVEPLPLDKLGLSERDLTELKAMASRSYGLILVCGPTGSGKTTTLHSVLHHINRPDIKIWTAEDPVEITQPGLRQVQINARIDWTFAAAMRSFLRADPDVIMVGEMRDAETTKIGIEASLTGHLVFSTLHTNSAAESVVRLLDLGMDPFNFADALIGILSQRLARKLCKECKRPHPASDGEIDELLDEYCAETELDKAAVRQSWQKEFAKDGRLILHQAVGCKACRDGYKGRMGVYELLSGSSQVKQLVRTRGSVPQIAQAARASGMKLLRQDAIEKVWQGVLDRVSARAASS